MMRLLKDTGAIFYNHKWRVQNGLIQDHADIIEGFPVRQIIIWRRKGGFNFNPGYFVPTYEVVYLIAKKKFKLAPKATATATFGNLHRNLRTATPRLFRLPYLIAALNPRPAEIILDPFSGSGTTSVAPLFTKSSTD
jgi:modification methylase